MTIQDLRFRRPEQHDELLRKLRDEGPFTANYESLLFAASVGKRNNRRAPFEKSGEPIRYHLLANKNFGDTFVDMLSVTEEIEDPEILKDDRLEDRLRIFEEYANGGLDYIQGELNKRSATVTDVIASMVSDALSEEPEQDDVVKDIADQLDW